MSNQERKRVFISYGHKDGFDFVRRLAFSLEIYVKVYTIYYLQGTKTVVSIYKVDTQTSVRVIKDELKYLESLETDLKAKNKAKTSSR